MRNDFWLHTVGKKPFYCRLLGFSMKSEEGGGVMLHFYTFVGEKNNTEFKTVQAK